MALTAGTSLGRYKIISPIGAGGMGEVYRAEDTLLNRQIAIKVLPQHLSDDSEALKRFQKEAKALASLNHSNILSIHDFVSDNGLSFVVMELLEGETLRSRINGSQISWQKSVEISIQIAEGLAAAHSKGVVHRDLKPENILFTSHDSVKIIDFGLARMKSDLPGEELTGLTTVSRATESGVVMGTVPYMSPEQVRGERINEQTDIFSFGCILYEMLSGKRPFSGKTSGEITASILRDEPNKLDEIPAELQRILQHCLEKNPERRLHSAHDLSFALKDVLGSSNNSKTNLVHRRKVWSSAIIIALTALVVIGFQKLLISRHPAEKIESLAVLPLKNLSGNPNQEFFADGMTEELISKLARISALRVISRTSVMEYKGSQKKSLPEIAKELHVDAIVEGSVMQSGSRVRITAQLVQARTDKHLWAESYERDLSDILGLQNEVASTIAQEISVKLTPQEKAHFAEINKVDPAAYEAYLRGINYAQRIGFEKEDLEPGISLLERAVEIDPKFARAYAALSIAHSRMYFSFDHTSERLAEAKRAVDTAFQLQQDLPEAHLALGYYYFWAFQNYQQALHEFSIAQKAAPNNAAVTTGIAATYKREGNLQSALEWNKKTLELDPRNAAAANEMGLVYMMLGEYELAEQYFDIAISLAPDNFNAYRNKVLAFLKRTGDTKIARKLIIKIPFEDRRRELLQMIEFLDRNYQTALDLLPLHTFTNFENDIAAGDCYRLMNKTSEAHASYDSARVELENLIENDSKRQNIDSFMKRQTLRGYIGFVYAGLNQREKAILEAKKAVELFPISKDAVLGPGAIRNLAVVYVMVGEYDAAIDEIEHLLSTPTALTMISVPLLRIDPTWDPLRSHPRFQKILEHRNVSNANERRDKKSGK
jgi:serine/threonine protein kinase/Tfp pilus assembly protein PilF